MALTANSSLPVVGAQLQVHGGGASGGAKVASGVTIYRGAAVGIRPDGYIKPFQAGDVLAGWAEHEFVGNASTDGGPSQAGTLTTAGQTTLRYVSRVERVKVSVSGAIASDIGKLVYAQDDNTYGFVGNPFGVVGRMVGLEASGVCLVDALNIGVPRTDNDGSSIYRNFDFSNQFATVTGTHASNIVSSYIEPGLYAGAIGAGGPTISIVDASDGYAKLLLDNDNEAEWLTLKTAQVFNVTRGIRAYFKGRLAAAGGAATDDVDFGLMSLSGGITATQHANMNDTTSGIKSILLHLDANANDVFASSDDDATAVSAVDTTVNNQTGTDQEYLLIVRTTGACEIWANTGSGWARYLSSTSFSVSTSGLFALIVNLEKSTGTGVPDVRINRMYAAGAAA